MLDISSWRNTRGDNCVVGYILRYAYVIHVYPFNDNFWFVCGMAARQIREYISHNDSTLFREFLRRVFRYVIQLSPGGKLFLYFFYIACCPPTLRAFRTYIFSRFKQVQQDFAYKPFLSRKDRLNKSNKALFCFNPCCDNYNKMSIQHGHRGGFLLKIMSFL